MGRMDPEAMLAEMTAEQAMKWRVYFAECYGEEEERRIATLVATMHNTAGKSYHGHFTAADFLPSAEPTPPQTTQQIRGIAEQAAAGFARKRKHGH